MSWNFALLLFILLVLTGLIWGLDILFLRQRQLARGGRTPWWVECGVSFFPVILVVFLLRSFLVEPFRIPSGSMLPTLQAGDLILVNKFMYGLRLPIVNKKIVEINCPTRGDIIVFRYPAHKTGDYFIKRVVGLPGDEVAYIHKKLYINQQEVTSTPDGNYYEPERLVYSAQFQEKLGDTTHRILLDKKKVSHFGPIWAFAQRDRCAYGLQSVRCQVPAGHYFVMGDNRDNSSDSRYWGFVPEENLVGKAFLIWMNLSDFTRIGRFY